MSVSASNFSLVHSLSIIALILPKIANPCCFFFFLAGVLWFFIFVVVVGRKRDQGEMLVVGEVWFLMLTIQWIVIMMLKRRWGARR